MDKYITRTIEQESLVPLWENDKGELFRGETAQEGYRCIGTAVVKHPPRKYKMTVENFVKHAECVDDSLVREQTE